MFIIQIYFQRLLIKNTFLHIYKLKERKNLYTTQEVFNLKKKKNKLWKRYRSTYSQNDLSNFKSVNNELKSLTRDVKKNYVWKTVSTKCCQLILNLKAFWQYINSRLKIRPNISKLITPNRSSVSSVYQTVLSKYICLAAVKWSLFKHCQILKWLPESFRFSTSSAFIKKAFLIWNSW